VGHIKDVVIGSGRTSQFDRKPLKAPGLAAGPDKLPLRNPSHVTDTLQVSHVSATQTLDGGIDVDLESLEAPRLAPRAPKLIIVNNNIANILEVHE
jgi:hypothetical protein